MMSNQSSSSMESQFNNLLAPPLSASRPMLPRLIPWLLLIEVCFNCQLIFCFNWFSLFDQVQTDTGLFYNCLIFNPLRSWYHFKCCKAKGSTVAAFRWELQALQSELIFGSCSCHHDVHICYYRQVWFVFLLLQQKMYWEHQRPDISINVFMSSLCLQSLFISLLNSCKAFELLPFFFGQSCQGLGVAILVSAHCKDACSGPTP